jgi:cytochrome c2
MLGGGTLAVAGETRLIVGVGTFAATTTDGAKTMGLLRAPGNHYGKLVEVALTDGSARVIASGLRDPNGVVVEADGSYLTTEHGPRGGDELNRVREGLDYGWPISTYGTDYFGFSWPLEKVPGGHSEFEPPLFAWVPSIAVSTMIRVEGTALKHWKGDLILGSLKAARLYRVRLRQGRVVLVEPILIGDRIRDVVETGAGEILVLLDRHPHVLRITEAKSGEAGMVQLCAGCHQIESGGRTTGAGPSLVGLIGRPVAGDPDYAYSEALGSAGGVWTRDRLADFLEEPQRFAPGTAMADPDLAPFTLLDIVQWFADRADGPPAR